MGSHEQYTSPYGGDGPLILGVSWSLASIATLLLVGRAWTASMKDGKLRWDFIWVSVANQVFALVGQVIITFSVAHGLGNHITPRTDPNDIRLASLYNWMSEIIIIVDIAFAKIAIVSFLLMIQGSTYPRMRYFLHFVWVTNLLLSVNQVILITQQCKPMPKFWDDTIVGTCDLRATVSKIGFLQGSVGAASDLALALYPMYIYWHLQLPLKIKIGLCALTGGGIIACAMATLKTIYIAVINTTSDVTAAFTKLVLWAFIELWLILIISSIPPLRPLFVNIFYKTSTFLSHSGQSIASGLADRESGLPSHGSPRKDDYKVHITRTDDKRRNRGAYDGDSDSQEGILPVDDSMNRNGIWVTRDIVLDDGRGFVSEEARISRQ
ncbi:hypothetical protein LTR56_008415 [Elasticomyces elasticus]|nr:hypothetical protein LTR22_016754 [Elasticomyces elasticus]KAK3646651.1 hypothetical protein LTR56_008415 [Elasticomyces elasticus]KAK4913773.1 hypothetical protein LTR49_017921 [Elasticomyces elasticus]KAK5757984.1 hypothetical protein LTS12_011879 [Elasticomyces elasticus]